MAKSKQAIIFSKFCLKCMWPNEAQRFTNWAAKNNVKVTVKRTAYRPSYHREATELYGSEDYMAFVYMDGKVTDLVSWAEKTKKKPVQSAKKKGAPSDVCGLPKAKRADRKDSVVVQKNKAEG